MGNTMDHIFFSLPEVLSLIGVFQCVYVLVHVTFRAGNFVRVILPVLYFFVLGTAFFIDLARGYISEITPHYDSISWISWTSVIPLSVLLIVQMSHITKLPSLVNWGILLVVPVAYISSFFLARYTDTGCSENINCAAFYSWLSVSGIVASALSLLAIWGHRNFICGYFKSKSRRGKILAYFIFDYCKCFVSCSDRFSCNRIWAGF